MEDVRSLIGRNILCLMKKQGITFVELAERLDVSTATIRRVIFQGMVLKPVLVNRIAQELGVTAEELTEEVCC